ncbi:MAG: SIMPL domain-containing protein [Pseudomonadota bacterium]
MPLIRACLVLLLFAVPAWAEGGRIAVTGFGEAATTPDIATIRIGVETRSREADDALAGNNARAGALTALAKERGVESRDIHTANLSIWPIYEQNRNSQPRADEPPKVVGFTVSNEVILRVRDLGGMGALLTDLVGAGANRMNGISFGVDDDAALLTEARKRAVADARAKAETYAAAAGVALGPIVSIDEAGGGVRPQPRAAMMRAAEAMPVEAGEAVVSASVRIVWEVAE